MKNPIFCLLLLFAVSGSSCANVQTPAALTGADMIGPDGIVYPDFTRAGISGGIPDIAAKARAENFGAIANDEQDDAAAIQKAVDSLGDGGGAVTLGAGRFIVDSTVKITKNGVAIRGAGDGKTVIVPRFEGQALDQQGDAPRTPVFLFSGISHPKRAKGLLTAPVARGDREIHLKEANKFLPGEVVYVAARKIPSDVLEILGPKLKVTSRAIYEKSVTGQYLLGQWRQNMALIERVEGETVFLDRPLRADLPLDIEPFADMNNQTLRGCGIEKLSIEQEVEKFAIDAIKFDRSYGSWVREVSVKKIGSWPLNINWTLDFEVRNAHFDDMRSRGGGGVGYFGINYSHDGLIEDSDFRRLRHVSVSFFSSGNVFRNCTIQNADINFHLRFPSENLFENCVVDSTKGEDAESRGSYGVAVYTPRYFGDIHEPDGGREVFWHNDFISYRGGVTLGGGGSSGNIFVYNRFLVEERPGVWIRKLSNDNLFKNNVFALKKWDVPFADWEQYQYEDNQSHERGAVVFLSGPANGNRFINNTFTGVPQDKLFVGVGAPAQNEGNVVEATFSLPPLPEAPVKSLFEWQKARRAKP